MSGLTFSSHAPAGAGVPFDQSDGTAPPLEMRGLLDASEIATGMPSNNPGRRGYGSR
jgi:hypothetical protein